MEAKNSGLHAPQQAPWLVFFSHGKRERTTTFFNVSDGQYNVRNIPKMRRKICVASYYGWFVMLDKTSQSCFLLNCTSFRKIQLPYPTFCKFSCCVLSSPPTDPDCVIILVSSTGYFIYCHPGSEKWIKRKYNIGNGDSKIFKVCCCNGKTYAYNLDKKLGIINVEAGPSITWLEVNPPRHPPLIQASTHCLVESNGEMFLVRMSHLMAISQIVKVEVYKMDFARMIWEEVQSIGDLVLFIGEHSSASCCATDSGIEGNCIYFTKENDKKLYVYSLDRGTISAKFSCQNVRPPWHTPLWAIPGTCMGFEMGSCTQGIQQKDLKDVQSEMTNSGGKEDMIELVSATNEDVDYRPWSDLPIHLLELIALRLFQSGFCSHDLCL